MSNVSNDSSQGFSKPQTLRVEDTCKWKEAIDPLKLLYSLVDPLDGKGAEFPVQKCTMKGSRQLAGKGLLPLLFPGTRSWHTGSQRDFIQRLLHTEDCRAISPGVRCLTPCMSQTGHLHPPSALPPGSSVSVPCFSHPHASLTPHSLCFPCSHPPGGSQVCPNSLLPTSPWVTGLLGHGHLSRTWRQPCPSRCHSLMC